MTILKAKVIAIMVEELGLPAEEIKGSSKIKDDLGADSLDAIEIIMSLEEEFNIEIPDSAANKFAFNEGTIDELCKDILELTK